MTARLRLLCPGSLPLLLVLVGSGCTRGAEAPPPETPAPSSGEVAAAEEPEVELPETEVGTRARNLVALLAAEDADGVEPFVTEQFAPAFRDGFPMDGHREVISGLWQQNPGLTLRHVVENGEHGLKLYLQSTKDSWLQVALSVEPEAPHRIAFLMFSPAAGPPDPAFAGMDPKAVTAEQRAKIVEKIDTLLRERYVEAELGARAGARVMQAREAGAYDDLVDLEALAERLTADLQAVTRDKHMRVRVAGPPPTPGKGAGPKGPPKGPPNGVGEAKVLSGNVGYLELRGFAPAPVAREAVTAAMKTLEETDAIIFDLRHNGGGAPDGVQYVCSYLFEEKTHLNSLYWREGDRTEEFWTLDEVDGKKRPKVPVFILTSGHTFSAGEEFVYNLKTRKRATVVGETTGGGANPGGVMEIAPQLVMFVPTGKAVNPVTKTNWEGTGVKPDVEVPADEALEKATGLARKAGKKFRKGG